jgi:hypothetical protein
MKILKMSKLMRLYIILELCLKIKEIRLYMKISEQMGVWGQRPQQA